MWTGHWMHGWGVGWGIGMWGMSLLWLVLLALLVVLVVRLVGHHGPHEVSRRTETPLEILKRRYARGEIDRAEFEQRRRDLT